VPSGDSGRIPGVGYDDVGVLVDQVLELEHVTLVGGSEVEAGKPAQMIDAGMQFKPEVPALVVAPESGNASSHLVTAGSASIIQNVDY
jgi:hypothetical protein